VFSRFFKSSRPVEREPIVGYAKLNMRLGPVARGRYFEEPLIRAFQQSGLGAVTGGGSKGRESSGTQGAPEGMEVHWCVIDVEMAEAERSAQLICDCLERHRAAKGSQLEFYVGGERFVADFGMAEGIGVYFNGTDLPREVYQQHRFNDVAVLLDKLIRPESAGDGGIFDTWHGPRESAMYMYGRSAELMKAAIAPFIADNPLCRGARVVTLA
jgi:hypothetical protein